MNSKQAKEIPIIKYLESQGILPENISHGKAYYLSPLRTEKTPSFKVDINKNVWIDYGEHGKGEKKFLGGKVLDLCMLMYSMNVSDASELLSSLNLGNHSNSFSFHKQETINTELEIKHIQPIQNKALIQYLTARKIPLNFAKPHIKEVYYNANNKKYFALAFENDKGGYELRNKYFKGSTSPKYYTSIKNNATSLNVFEGFFDFLTALAYFKIIKPNNDTIILNSLAFLDKIVPELKNYKRINLYLDNDKAGQKAVESIKNNHSLVINQAVKIYPNHKDFNAFLTETAP